MQNENAFLTRPKFDNFDKIDDILMPEGSFKQIIAIEKLNDIYSWNKAAEKTINIYHELIN